MRTDLLIVSNPTEMEWLVMGEKDAASVLVQSSIVWLFLRRIEILWKASASLGTSAW